MSGEAGKCLCHGGYSSQPGQAFCEDGLALKNTVCLAFMSLSIDVTDVILCV